MQNMKDKKPENATQEFKTSAASQPARLVLLTSLVLTPVLSWWPRIASQRWLLVG